MLDLQEICLRITAALLAGGIVGLNRDLFGKPTGIRLHSLVALGAAVTVMAALDLNDPAAPSRIIQGIVGGIGFLGAGVIMHGMAQGPRSFDIHHMATAASIWLTAALGIAADLGQWRLTGAATVAALFVLIVGLRLDRMFAGRFREDKND